MHFGVPENEVNSIDFSSSARSFGNALEVPPGYTGTQALLLYVDCATTRSQTMDQQDLSGREQRK